MNKIVACVGTAALGASMMQSISAQEIVRSPAQRPWSVAATVRGFYDDNVNTSPVDAQKVDSFGIEVSPAVGFAWTDEATTINAGYRYSLKYYDEAIPGTFDPNKGGGDHTDQTHNFMATLTHDFSERYRIALTESFVIGQEPDSLRSPGQASDQFQRVSGQNIRNYAGIIFDARMTPLFNTELGYNNSYFNYDATFDESLNPRPVFPTLTTSIIPSPSGLLDRVENTGFADLQYLMSPSTTLLGGYQLRAVNYTGDEPITGFNDLIFGRTVLLSSDQRNSVSHYGYAGINHAFRPDFTASLKLGIQYSDFYNLPDQPNGQSSENSGTSPFVQAMLTYQYAPESSLHAGFTHSRTPIYDNTATDADTSVLWLELRHRIVPRLFGSVTGTFQSSTMNGVVSNRGNDDKTDLVYGLGLNLEYFFNSYFSAEIGYNWDKMNSDIIGDWDRNRVYIGVTARY